MEPASPIAKQTMSDSDINVGELRLRDEEREKQKCDKGDGVIYWVQCDMCSKWRKLPPGVDASSLPREWNCDVGGKLNFGLNCHVAEESVSEGDALPQVDEVDDSHQPLTGGYRVKRVSVLLHNYEETIITRRTPRTIRPSSFACASMQVRSSILLTNTHTLRRYTFYGGSPGWGMPFIKRMHMLSMVASASNMSSGHQGLLCSFSYPIFVCANPSLYSIS